MESSFRGIGVSPGIAVAPALVFDLGRFEVPHYHIQDPAAELERLERAVHATQETLTRLYRKTAVELGEPQAEIFNAHLMLLDDVTIREEIERRVREDKVNVEQILVDLTRRYQDVMKSAEDPMLQERTEDLSDVVDRLLHHLLDEERPDLRTLEHECIIVANELSPSDAACINPKYVKAVAMDSGSATSHTAILARALEIPAVVGLKRLSANVQPEGQIMVDGTSGLVVTEPGDRTIEQYQRKVRAMEQRRAALRRAARSGPCKTHDGVPVPLKANIALPVEVAHDFKSKAEGVGLYRTEFLFLNRQTLPSEEEQCEAYSEVVKAVNPLPVTIRTIDIGGDKFAAHLEPFREENPQLGWRAVRFCLERPDIFKTQLRAILRASAKGHVELMFPMVSGLAELRAVKAIVEEVREDLRAEKIPFDTGIKIGTMVEVPSAVILAELLAKECDFFSIGTNDLIQYSLAVDRVNQKIAHLYDPTHPAILRMIKHTTTAAKDAGIHCCLGGEMAGGPLYTELLLGLGVESLSMSAVALHAVRAAVARSDSREAEELANEALALTTAAEVRALLDRRLKDKEPAEFRLSDSWSAQE